MTLLEASGAKYVRKWLMVISTAVFILTRMLEQSSDKKNLGGEKS